MDGHQGVATQDNHTPALEQLRDLVDTQVRPTINWYQSHKRWPRRLHRMSVAGTIVLGASIPVMAVVAGTAFREVTSVVGALIAIITGLAATYKWDRTWNVFSAAQTRLECELALWEFAMAKAGSEPTKDALAQATDVTEKLLLALAHVRETEADSFFALTVGSEMPAAPKLHNE